jgi:pimeloyl-[acyl-carrier protein] methyl ester esterase
MRLVLLPGLDGTGLLFEPLCRELSSSVRPLTLDYPRDRVTSYDELFELIQPKLPTTEPYVLLGESYGGPLSLKLAATQPVGLCGLILSATFVTCPHGYVPQSAAHLVVPAAFYLAPPLAKLKAVFGRYSTPEIQALISRGIATVSPAVLAARVREVIAIDVTEELLACPVPILYIQATNDYVVPASNLARIQRLRPDVEVARVESAHMILQSRAKRSAEIIEQFVRAQSTSGVPVTRSSDKERT